MRPAIVEAFRGYPSKDLDGSKVLNVISLKSVEAVKIKKVKLRHFLWEQQKGRCLYCLDVILKPADGTLDHIFPKSLGGVQSIGNSALVCKQCNLLKGSLMSSARAKKISSIYLKIAELLESKGYL